MSSKSNSTKNDLALSQITATSQTSRFHTETLTTLSKEIDLKTVNLAIGKKDILLDAHLRLKSDVTYGLLGRNGQGKSTILRALAEKIIPGIADNLRILLVGQVENDARTVSKEAKRVVQHVVDLDTRRAITLEEWKALSAAAESSSTVQVSEAIKKVDLAREYRALELARLTASKRSGARGAQARKDLLVAEARVKEAESRLKVAEDAVKNGQGQDGDADKSTIIFTRVQDMIEDLRLALDSMDSDATESKARSILIGLGFTPEKLDSKFDTLSGGWQSRCTLASALLQKPDLLILDEPTNYLDIPSILYLQRCLEDLTETTILIVAHDREFLDAITHETIVLQGQKLTYHEGSITDYERATLKKRKHMINEKAVLDKKKAAIQQSIKEGAKIAKKTDNENMARMVKSRQKKLDERWGLERNDKGHKFKLNRDFGGFHVTNRAAIEIDDLEQAVDFPFPAPEPMRFPGSLCSASEVSFRYSSRGPYIVEDATLVIHPGDRVGLVGNNGEGKSTLVKILTGQLKPTKGALERHSRLRFGYYSQDSVEELSKSNFAGNSALDHFRNQLQERYQIDLGEPMARAFLGSFGLRGQTTIIPIGLLSGGQKVRLALALVVYPAPDLLVLDEVSTHLDMDTTAGLMRSLRSFAGAILLVSHDRHLIKCVVEGGPLIPPSELVDDDDSSGDDDDEDADGVKVGTVYSVGPKGKVRALQGGVNDYVVIMERKLAKVR